MSPITDFPVKCTEGKTIQFKILTLDLLSIESMSGKQLITMIHKSITTVHLKKTSDVVVN